MGFRFLQTVEYLPAPTDRSLCPDHPVSQFGQCPLCILHPGPPIFLRCSRWSRKAESNQHVFEKLTVTRVASRRQLHFLDGARLLASGHNGDITGAAYGYEPTREAAMTDAHLQGPSWARPIPVAERAGDAPAFR